MAGVRNLSNDENNKLLARGLMGEALVREWLKLRGFFVLPTSLIRDGGAPMLASCMAKIIASDILVSGNGESFWVEVKTYERYSHNSKRKRDEHGVPIRQWEAYLEGQKLTGIKGYLCILEVENEIICEGTLDYIAVGAVAMPYHPVKSGPNIFFDRRRFELYDLHTLMKTEDIKRLMPPPIPSQTIRPWEKKKLNHKERQPPLAGF
jgi:hypothetical protein